jgi:broad specificity phosphatase PhoE
VTGAGCTIFLARHGETEWNRVGRWQGMTDIPLSDQGRAQALALGDRLRGAGITRAYTSHLARAHETAEIVAAALGLQPPIVDGRLAERGYGSFEGLTRQECAERHPGAWKRYLADRRVTPPNAEPQHEIVARVTEAMEQIAAASEDGASVIAISHGGSIRSFVDAAIGVVLPPVGNGSMFRIRFQDGRFVSVEGF